MIRSPQSPCFAIFRLAAALLIAAVLASGCGRDPVLGKLAPDAVVLAFGDSLTYGTGAKAEESYPAQLASLIGRTVISSGVPGQQTAAALARLPGALDQHSPRLLLLCIGGNDFLRNTGKAQAERNVREMVKLARARGVDVLLIGTPERSLTVTPPGFFADIAKEFDVPYEGGVIGSVLRDSSLKSDSVHPNAKGYRVIAENVAELLRKSGAI